MTGPTDSTSYLQGPRRGVLGGAATWPAVRAMLSDELAASGPDDSTAVPFLLFMEDDRRLVASIAVFDRILRRYVPDPASAPLFIAAIHRQVAADHDVSRIMHSASPRWDIIVTRILDMVAVNSDDDGTAPYPLSVFAKDFPADEVIRTIAAILTLRYRALLLDDHSHDEAVERLIGPAATSTAEGEAASGKEALIWLGHEIPHLPVRVESTDEKGFTRFVARLPNDVTAQINLPITWQGKRARTVTAESLRAALLGCYVSVTAAGESRVRLDSGALRAAPSNGMTVLRRHDMLVGMASSVTVPLHVTETLAASALRHLDAQDCSINEDVGVTGVSSMSPVLQAQTIPVPIALLATVGWMNPLQDSLSHNGKNDRVMVCNASDKCYLVSGSTVLMAPLNATKAPRTLLPAQDAPHSVMAGVSTPVHVPVRTVVIEADDTPVSPIATIVLHESISDEAWESLTSMDGASSLAVEPGVLQPGHPGFSFTLTSPIATLQFHVCLDCNDHAADRLIEDDVFLVVRDGDPNGMLKYAPPGLFRMLAERARAVDAGEIEESD